MTPRHPLRRAKPADATAAALPAPVALPGHAPLRHWQRLGEAVRCAYAPDRPDLIRDYLDAGEVCMHAACASELQVAHRSLQLLLRTALDQALPLRWREACLIHSAGPLGRMQGLLALHDPVAVNALHTLVEIANHRLAEATPVADAAPGAGASFGTGRQARLRR